MVLLETILSCKAKVIKDANRYRLESSDRRWPVSANDEPSSFASPNFAPASFPSSSQHPFWQPHRLRHAHRQRKMERSYKLYSRCSGKYVQILHNSIDANGSADSPLAQLRVLSTGFGSQVQLQSERSGRFLCLTKRMQLISLAHGNHPNCHFVEEMDSQHYTQFRLATFSSTFLGFNRRGRQVPPERYAAKHRCFQFLKIANDGDAGHRFSSAPAGFKPPLRLLDKDLTAIRSMKPVRDRRNRQKTAAEKPSLTGHSQRTLPVFLEQTAAISKKSKKLAADSATKLGSSSHAKDPFAFDFGQIVRKIARKQSSDTSTQFGERILSQE